MTYIRTCLSWQIADRRARACDARAPDSERQIAICRIRSCPVANLEDRIYWYAKGELARIQIRRLSGLLLSFHVEYELEVTAKKETAAIRVVTDEV
jgi:hypothetical protein